MSEPGRCPRLLVLSSPHPPAGPMPDPSSGLLCSPAASITYGALRAPDHRAVGEAGVEAGCRHLTEAETMAGRGCWVICLRRHSDQLSGEALCPRGSAAPTPRSPPSPTPRLPCASAGG